MKKPKILIFDIETSPNLGWVWGMWEQNVIEFDKDWYILSFSAKWLDSNHTIAKGLPDYPEYKKDRENDKELVKDLWQLLNEADIVVAHNGDEFDIKKCHTRFVEHGMTPPAPFKSIDTKKVAKRYFRFDSNKLDELGRHFGLGRKLHTGGFELWKGCMQGDKKSWKKMIAYNKQDVLLLEKVYLKMRPWIVTFPNYLKKEERPSECPVCNGTTIQSRGAERRAGGKIVGRFQCQTCGKWLYGKK